MGLKESRAALEQALLGDWLAWKDLRPLAKQWWADLKRWEATDTFEAAFKDNRMTARQINIGKTARGGEFPVINKAAPEDKLKERNIKLERDVASIKARTKPENFFNRETGKSMKNELGLHDLSASLLDGKRKISEQLKRYEESVVLFMPVPNEEDLQLFCVLNDISKLELKDKDDNDIREMRSQLTRIKLAQASDMGTKYVDVSNPEDPKSQAKFRYGVTGTIIRQKGGIGLKASEQEIKARRSNALRYKSILESEITKVNEVVMAYRAHASSTFPMFAIWMEDPKEHHFLVVNPDTGGGTGMVVTDGGKYRKE